MEVILIESNYHGEVNGDYETLDVDCLADVIKDMLIKDGHCLGVTYNKKFGVLVDTTRSDVGKKLPEQVWGIFKKYQLKKYLSKLNGNNTI